MLTCNRKNMWIEVSGSLLNLDKIAIIYPHEHEYEHDGVERICWYIHYFPTIKSHYKWLKEDEEYDIECSFFPTEEERDARYEELKAMLIKKPRVELF